MILGLASYLLAGAGLVFPLVAKTHLGPCGHGVCKLASMTALRDDAELNPDGETLVPPST